MASLTIRNLDEVTKQRLRLRAAQHGLSMEEEARRLLRETLAPAAPQRLGQRLSDRFAAVSDAAFEPPARHAPRPVPRLDEAA